MASHTRARSASPLHNSPSGRPRNSTPAKPRTAAAASCSWRRMATSSCRLAPGSHVPFEPSVSTSRCTSAPPAAHLASVAPQPNSTSSEWAPIASARAGTGSSGDKETEPVEIVGYVDVAGEGREAARQWEIGVRDQGASATVCSYPRTTCGGGIVERAGIVDDLEPASSRPVAHVGRARYDDGRELTGGRADAVGQLASEVGAVPVVELRGPSRLFPPEFPPPGHDA